MNKASDTQSPGMARRVLTLADLTDDMLWPRLLAAPRLALKPERLGVAFFALLLLVLAARAPIVLTGSPGPIQFALAWAAEAWSRLAGAILSFDAAAFAPAFRDLAYGTIVETISRYPWTFLPTLGLMLAIWALAGAAISRMAVCDFAQGVVVSWPRALAFSIRSWGASFASYAGPALVAAAIGLVIAGAGALLLTSSVGLALAGPLYLVALLGGLVIVLIGAALFLAGPLFIPAVVADGADSIDAFQRGAAYVIGCPLRFLLYAAQLIVQAVVVTVLLWFAAWLINDVTARTAAFFAGADALALLTGARDAGGIRGFAASLIAIWTELPRLVVGAFVLSCFFSSSSVLYLLLRRVNDGQDIAEIWMPSMIGGGLAPLEDGPDDDDD